MSDEGFHEIQLNGKQLVFLFMAATVVSVVIFLCGVMVGRGVRAERAPVDAPEATLSAAPSEPAPAAERPAPTAAADARHDEAPSPPANQEPPATAEDDVYQQLMEGNEGKGETLTKKSEPRPASKPAAAAVPASSKANEPATKSSPAPKEAPLPAKADMGPTDPGTYAVQVAALRERFEADAIARRLTGKGYAAYVLVPAVGAAPVYKVQVGRFKNRQDAEKIAARLKKEEQFRPWVTR
jgi:cell division septation protein DedD